MDSHHCLSMDYQKILERFNYDDGADITARISNVQEKDYQENRDIINEIVLWKMNRRPSITEELIDAILGLNNISTPLQAVESSQTGMVLEQLLQTKGIQLPMASTILHFYYPDVYPIIDQRAYRELYGIDYPKTMIKVSSLVENYRNYIRDCHEYQQENCPEIAFSLIDKVLYQLDKEKGNKVKY